LVAFILAALLKGRWEVAFNNGAAFSGVRGSNPQSLGEDVEDLCFVIGHDAVIKRNTQRLEVEVEPTGGLESHDSLD
jgi:hypothetical protein